MKILSLDGGGSWALIEARCLYELYRVKYGNDVTGHQVLCEFDIAVSNSGGSIVLACLAEGMKLTDVIALFRNEDARRSMFSQLKLKEAFWAHMLRMIAHIGPKYSAERKLQGLLEHLPVAGSKYMSELPAFIGKPTLQLLICSFDYERNREVFFRSYEGSAADSGNMDKATSKFIDVKLAEAAHGSSNAPIDYFDAPAQIQFKNETNKRPFWDGAIGGYNNPAFAGVIEAIANGADPNDISVLSIGTGSLMRPLLRDQSPTPGENLFLYGDGKPGLLNDIQKMSGSILDDPPDASSYHSYVVMRDEPKNKKFFRFSPLIKPVRNADGSWRVPKNFTAAVFEQLTKLDMDAVANEDVALIDQLCTEWLNPDGEIANQSIRNNANLEPVVGYGSFAEAKAAFEQNF
jgi:patatin-like phospholipase/acyl hydrolase